MITPQVLNAFVASTGGHALREGTRYARQARVGAFAGTQESVTTIVRGRSGEFEVAIWVEGGVLQHRCECPSWREPCKHEVAAAIALRGALEKGTGRRAPGERGEARGRGGARFGSGAADGTERRARTAVVADASDAKNRKAALTAAAVRATGARGTEIDPAAARAQALAERVRVARGEKLAVHRDEPPFVRVESVSGFRYRVQLRGGPDGLHGCDCPDFEANRLHTCKHVERVRGFLARSPPAWLRAHRSAASRPRVYLHFGEIVEPRLFATPSGPGAPEVRAAFSDDGIALRPIASDFASLRRWLARFGAWVEPHALAWLDERIARTPRLPDGGFARLLPRTALRPYPYQLEGAEFLARRGRALLADEMGLGKTVQALLAVGALRSARDPVRRITVVCPASLRGNWQDEIRRWLGEEATLLEGLAPARAATIASRPRWLVTHYEQVWRDYRRHAEHAPDLLVIDEAQRAKGLDTRTARVLKAIGARHVFALTGTPLENRLEDAYAIAQLVDQRLLPPLWQLDRDHFVRDANGRSVVMYRGLGALRSRLAPAFLRRRKEEVALQLPALVRSVSLLPMHPAVSDTYDDVMMQVARIATKKVILPADLERMQRLLVIARRCCNGPHMLGKAIDDAKVPKLAELTQLLRELCMGEGRKAIVFSEWTDMTERVEAVCRKLELFAVHLRGDVPVNRRGGLIRAFTQHDGPAVFISTDAGGVGLNLQAADVVVNLDLPWNPARLEQRIARAHRIGSKRTVQVILLVTEQSVEHRILALHDVKRGVLDNVWARGGEDAIAAPGGSGAFRAMVQELLRTEAPVAVASRGRERRGAHRDGRDGLGKASGNGKGESFAREKAPARSAARSARDEGPRAPARSGLPDGDTVASVDASALATAVAAVVPSLPAEQRRALATVFRVVADVLDARSS